AVVVVVAGLAAAVLFGGLVHAVLVAAPVSEPAATTVYGLTPRRLWATAVDVLALVGHRLCGSVPCRASYRGLRPTWSDRGSGAGPDRRHQRRAGFGSSRRRRRAPPRGGPVGRGPGVRPHPV